jgi:hypothetical protein
MRARGARAAGRKRNGSLGRAPGPPRQCRISQSQPFQHAPKPSVLLTQAREAISRGASTQVIAGADDIGENTNIDFSIASEYAGQLSQGVFPGKKPGISWHRHLT